MELADRFGLPVLSLRRYRRRLSRRRRRGARPGRGNRPRRSRHAFSSRVPLVATIIGEGGSGGAIALAAGDQRADARTRGLFRDLAGRLRLDPLARPRAQEAATAMKITAQDLITLGVIDEIIPEPLGGAHRDPAATITSTGRALSDALKSLAIWVRTNSGMRGRRSSWLWGGRFDCHSRHARGLTGNPTLEHVGTRDLRSFPATIGNDREDAMLQTWRWFGPDDPVSLEHVAPGRRGRNRHRAPSSEPGRNLERRRRRRGAAPRSSRRASSGRSSRASQSARRSRRAAVRSGRRSTITSNRSATPRGPG